MLSKLKKEFTDPENLKDMERGVFFGLIVGTVLAALFTTSDYLALNFDYIRGQNPYGVLWFILNGHFWEDLPYRLYIMGLVLSEELLMWGYWVVRGMTWRGKTIKLNKFLFYAGWLQCIIWMRGSVFQNVTVTLFAPLGSIAPWFIVPFMLLQKLPIGWSWNFSDAHWWCAFVGNSGFTAGDTITFPNGQQLISCPGGWLRWNPVYSWFWSYAMIMFWLIVPTLFWLKPRIKKWRFKRKLYKAAKEVLLKMEKERTKEPLGGEESVYEVPEEGPCCEGGDMCHGECADTDGERCDDCGTTICDGRCEDD